MTFLSKICFLVFVIQPVQVFAQGGNIIKKIRVDPEAAVGGNAARFIDSITYVPLETTKESRFHYIYQLDVADDHFIVLEKENNAVLIFTKTGKFRAKIKVEKNVFQFSFDQRSKLIEIVNFPESVFYNLNGELIKKSTLTDRPNTMMGITKTALDNNYTVFYNNRLKATKDSLIYQLLVYKNNRITNWFLPYPQYYKFDQLDQMGSINFGPDFNDTDTGVYYIRSYDYTVYRLTPGSLKPVYQFMFPVQYSLPQNFITDTSYNGNRMALLRKDRLIIPRLFRFYKKGNQLFFSEGKHSYILDEPTQTLVDVNKIVSDSVSNFLPVTETEVDPKSKSVYLDFDGNCFYFSCPAEVIFNQMEASKNKRITYSPELAVFFNDKKNRVEGNPVLVKVKFKSVL
jgi:hypothetical protein